MEERDMDGGLPSPDGITRYDFLDGTAVGGKDLVSAPASLPPGREGAGFARIAPHIEHYDCVIVGGGASGLAAADSYRDRFGEDTRILILEALGHASGHASPPEPARSAFTASHGLSDVLLFDRGDFGRDAVVADRVETRDPDTEAGWRAFLARTPYDGPAVDSIVRVQTQAQDWLGAVHGRLDVPERIELLTRLSYERYLVDYLGVGPQAVLQYQRTSNALLGAGIAAVSAADMWLLGAPGFGGLGLGDRVERPGAGPAGVDRAARDMPGDAVRLRLDSRVIKVRPAVSSRGGLADVLYIPNGTAGRATAHLVRASHVIMACWDRLTAQIVDGLPRRQMRGLTHAPTAPLIHGQAELRNWRAFADAGISAISPRGAGVFWDHISLSVGGPGPAAQGVHPDGPASLRFTVVPSSAPNGAGAAGTGAREVLLGRSLADLEADLLDMLDRTVNAAGGDFDPARDISVIAINRWRHGYAHGARGGAGVEAAVGPLRRGSPGWAGAGRREPLRNVAIADGRVGAFGHAAAASDEGRRAVWDLPVPSAPYWKHAWAAD